EPERSDREKTDSKADQEVNNKPCERINATRKRQLCSS
ncbi:MAG: hypothetical protein RLZZ515_2208, partial [Cyanobacteriota bacterium]